MKETKTKELLNIGSHLRHHLCLLLLLLLIYTIHNTNTSVPKNAFNHRLAQLLLRQIKIGSAIKNNYMNNNYV